MPSPSQDRPERLMKPRLQGRAMSDINTFRVQSIYRYPVKGLTPELLASSVLEIGKTLPADRRYAIENGPSGFDPAAPSYLPKQRFLTLMKNERLARLETRYDDATGMLVIRAGGRSRIFSRAFAPTSCAGRHACCTPTATASPMSRPRSCRSSTSPRLPRSRPPSACQSIHCAFAG